MTGVGKESSITVTVRVRPFTAAESAQLRQNTNEPVFLGDGSFAGGNKEMLSQTQQYASFKAGKRIRKIINVVDDKMLIFDPPESNPLASMQRAAFPKTTNRIREHRFVFDQLFDESATQEDVYCHTTKPLIDNVLDGYNASVFAYGATGCGKTHTISGTPEQPGIIFLTMKELFERIETLQDEKIVDISLSFLEIYNETIRDLLDPENQRPKVLREDAEKRISVSNLSTHRPETVEDLMDMILQGNSNRTISPTEANATSSRSHAVLQINVTQKSRTAELSEAHTFATLSIIDLAGSERAAATKNRGGRLMEGANINKSLLALGNCINALCDPRQRGHVPYRDSKLTRLLKFSLGGNCKTVMIVCVSPSSVHYDETLNTLKYADRAKKIKTKWTRNEHNLDRHVGSYLKMITEQRAEIEQLRAREKTVVDAALAKQEKVRQGCYGALQDAVYSLETTISKTSQAREQRAKCIMRMRSIENQLNQLSIWITAIEQHLGASNGRSMLDNAIQVQNKLLAERDSLQLFMSTGLQDEAAVHSAISLLSNRLRETSGWTDADSEAFNTYAEMKKGHTRNAALEQAIGEVPAASSLKPMASLLFSTLSQLQGVLSQTGEEEQNGGFYESLAGIVDQAMAEGAAIMEPRTFNDNSTLISSTHTNTNSTLTSSTLTGASGNNNYNNLQNNDINDTQPTKPQARAVNRSPEQPLIRKPSKRVRWEDEPSSSPLAGDGDIDMHDAIPSPKPLSLDDSINSFTVNSSSIINSSTLNSSSIINNSTNNDDSDDSTVGKMLSAGASRTSRMSLTSRALPKSSPRAKRFGVKSELRRKPATSKAPNSVGAALGVNRRNVTRVEKENLEQLLPKGFEGGSPVRRLGMPLRVAVPTAASAMKQVTPRTSGPGPTPDPTGKS
ncbi:hypothetical protein TRVA0_019S01508 [Trichomonascus vanleenenianus]|uniref:tubulin-dependent ATPase KIP3 n=1 Tax=Trichomonascus vanleenenianus TaxID=2268995 RepID=UPI003EC98021